MPRHFARPHIGRVPMKFYFRAQDINIQLPGHDTSGKLVVVWKRGPRRTETAPIEVKEQLSSVDGSLRRTATTLQDLAIICTMFKNAKTGAFESKPVLTRTPPVASVGYVRATRTSRVGYVPEAQRGLPPGPQVPYVPRTVATQAQDGELQPARRGRGGRGDETRHGDDRPERLRLARDHDGPGRALFHAGQGAHPLLRVRVRVGVRVRVRRAFDRVRVTLTLPLTLTKVLLTLNLSSHWLKHAAAAADDDDASVLSMG